MLTEKALLDRLDFSAAGMEQAAALLRSGQVDFTIGQDLAYQPYQSLKLLFDALSGRLPRQDCYTASPILNAETV